MRPRIPLRARFALAVQQVVERILDPWLQLIPDDPDPGLSDYFEEAKESLREEGRQEVFDLITETALEALDPSPDQFDA